MPASSSAWTGFSARPESAPVLSASGADGAYALTIQGNNVPSVYGGWRTRISGLIGGQSYRFRTRVVTAEVERPREAITLLLRWRGSFGEQVAPDYVWQYRTQSDGSLVFDRTLPAPAGTTAVDIELALQWDSNGRVTFDALSLTAVAAPASRPVKVAAISYRPSGTSSGVESVQRAAQFGEQVAATHHPDLMVFGEMLNVIGAPGTYNQKAESIPGASTDVMASLARTYSVNVVFGMLEAHGGLLYNAAVLIDRSGTIVGKYRKMQLPLSEVAAGITPGNDVPVFDTDFGRVALLICQDSAFPEPARQAAIGGAELILLPIWGGKSSLVAARAIEQSVYVVASGYDYLSEVVDPLGRVLARVEHLNQADAAVATIDLNQRFREDWIGDWRDTSGKQRRIGVYKDVEPSEPGELPPPPPENVAPSVSLTSPANGATYTAPATVNLSAAAFDSDGSVARVEFLSGTTVIATDTAAPYEFSWSSVPAGSYTLSARAVDNGNLSATSSAVTITVSAPPSGLPSPWQTQDIGAVGLAGSATASNGTFTVEGAGADIWGSADAFRFVWQPITGDVDIVARVASIEYVHDWVKAGVMIRERLTADSAHGLMLASPGVKGLAFQRRKVSGGLSNSTSGGAGTPPVWVKLERRGSTITAYRSADGVTWTLVGSDTFTMTADAYVGLAVSSHSTSELATVMFDNVKVTVPTVTPPPPALPSPWQSQDIGAVGVSGTASASNGTFSVKGAGADVWGTADAFHYVWQPISGDREIVARVASAEYVHDWVKSGVMIRERLTADSPHAFMIVTPGIKGLAFQRRTAAGGLTTSTSGGSGTPPAWVRLVRSGNVISAYRSADGVSWTLVGSDTFTMGADVYVGLAVSSHDTTRTATVTFDNVLVR